jgi:curved DNA-binding protein CbpA
LKENWEIHWKDYYTILQIHPLAEPEVVKAAYIKLANKYAPDKNPNTAPDKIRNLNEAYEIISNLEKRERYYIAYCHTINQTPTITHTPQQNTPYQQKQTTQNVNFTNNLTIDEKIALVLKIASHDKNIYFRRKDWERKIKEVKEWVKNYNSKYPLLYKGGVFGISYCPYCKQNYVLENKDASVRRCVNPICDYILTPEYTWAKNL